MTILKGDVDGFSYFSLISVILFSNQEHPRVESCTQKNVHGDLKIILKIKNQ